MLSEPTAALSAAHDAARSWLFDQALPFWADAGVDRVNGGFFERVSPAGVILDDPRRTRLVGRQIYVFATAERLGWNGDARAIVRHGLDFLLSHCARTDGTFVSVVSPQGQALNGAFDLYDHAFALFGMAAAAHVGERTEALSNAALRTRDVMVKGWGHPLGGFEESVPRSLPLKANPHMHMLEASLAWHEVRPQDGWDILANQMAELCLERFLDPDTGALMEFFDGDWRAIRSGPEAVVEPGHQMEWAWLQRRWGLMQGRPDAVLAADRLQAIGEGPGVDPVRDLTVNELNIDLTMRDDRARLWPQTERTKAHVLKATTAPTAAERDVATATAARAIQGLMKFFDHPVSGAWWEHIGADGLAAPEPARASSLYHITCALAEVDGALKAS